MAKKYKMSKMVKSIMLYKLWYSKQAPYIPKKYLEMLFGKRPKPLNEEDRKYYEHIYQKNKL